ncbi:MAG: hypothetical protein ACTSYA_01470 [Candidatus Kariarchaeaceae archaeon]
MELISVNIKKRHGIDQRKLSTSNALEREQIARSLDEEMIHFHVIDQILKMETDATSKRKLILASVPDENVIIKRLEIINQANQVSFKLAGLLEEIVTSLSN